VSDCLVAYATRHGATAEIAEALAEALRRADHSAEVRPADQVETLDGYDAVIIGSAVYYGHWLDPARELAERLTSQLAARPVWLFSSGPLGPPEQLVPEGECVDVGSVAESTSAVDHRAFAGRLDKSALGFREKAVVAALKPPEGDFRDWDAIARYAAEIADWLRSMGRE
jgi:menaquinone-dependent protoporphyrinogen oxidase